MLPLFVTGKKYEKLKAECKELESHRDEYARMYLEVNELLKRRQTTINNLADENLDLYDEIRELKKIIDSLKSEIEKLK